MSRSYWRVAPAFWLDEHVSGWDDATKLLALFLLTCPHRSAEGLFRLPKGYITEDLKWTSDRLAEPFARLIRDGFIEYDEEVQVCFLVNALKYQAPENDNQVKYSLRIIEGLPRTPLLGRLFGQAEQYSERLAKALQERFPERLPKPPAPPPAPAPPQTPPPTLTLAAAATGDCGSAEDQEEQPASDALVRSLWEVKGWKPDETADRELLADLSQSCPRADLRQVIADVHTKAKDGALKANPRTALRGFAKRAHHQAAPIAYYPEIVLPEGVQCHFEEQEPRRAEEAAAQKARKDLDRTAA